MEINPQPTLTIGMIFRNDIRHLERCLESLSPLRDKISCELIMADTGSDDGSRRIALRYADILFDFPWINDFSAARNAVMKKASGQWYLSIDADEYLDSDISELVCFLKSEKRDMTDICSFIIRNYTSAEDTSKYSDFFAMRLMRMATGLRFHGAIHEAWPFTKTDEPELHLLHQTLLHHDGYIGMHEKKGEDKRNRNLGILNEMLSRNPNDLLFLLQYVESGKNEDDFLEKLKLAASLVEKKIPSWNELGPSIFRHAVCVAQERNLPELSEWITRSQKWFPDSFFTRIDVGYVSFMCSWDTKDYVSCISKGEEYLQALKEYQNGQGDQQGLLYGCLTCSSAYFSQTLKLLLAASYVMKNNLSPAMQLVENMDYSSLNEEQIRNLMYILCNIHTKSNIDTAPALLRLFKDIKQAVSNNLNAKKRLNAFYSVSLHIFADPGAEDDTFSSGSSCRPSYTFFLPLAEQCELGLGAMILETRNVERIHLLLAKTIDWGKLPPKAMFHALESGVVFPMPECLLTLEEIDTIISGLASYPKRFFSLLKSVAESKISDNWQKILWKRGIMIAAVRTYPWADSTEDAEQKGSVFTEDIGSCSMISGLEIVRVFAQTERVFLPRYYMADLLCDENLFALPALHRFGWHCAHAFDALDAGNTLKYIQELKTGMKSAPETSVIVEYMINHTPRLQIPQKTISKELLNLAEQVKKLLSAYPPNHPAVAAIKASEAYQKVAELIEL